MTDIGNEQQNEQEAQQPPIQPNYPVPMTHMINARFCWKESSYVHFVARI